MPNMLRCSKLVTSYHNRRAIHSFSATNGLINTPSSRHFFWSGNDDDDNSNNGKGGNQKSKKPKEMNANSSDGNGEEVISSGAAMPTKIGIGDEAPRYPHLTALPLINKPLFPGIITSVTVSDEATIDALEKIKGTGAGGYVATFLRKKYPTGVTEGGVLIDHPEVITDASDIYKVGTLAQIHRINRNFGHQHDNVLQDTIIDDNDPDINDDKSVSVLLLAHRRIGLLSVDNVGPPIDTLCSHWPKMYYKMGEDKAQDDIIRALSNEVLKTVRDIAQTNPLFRENVNFYPMRVDSNDPYRLADFAASLTTGSPEELQNVLEEKDPEARLQMALELLSKERELSKIQQEISKKVEEKMSETQRKYMLTEQLKSIKKELGMEKDDKEALLTKYRKKMASYSTVPEEISEVIDSELEKLSTLEKNSSEFNVTRSYLDWLTSVPWGEISEENFDIKRAREVLDRDHYGMDEVKDTILAYIAIGKLKGGIQGKILCLSGPPVSHLYCNS